VSEKVLFKKVFVDNLISWDDDKKVEGYVYLTSDQEIPKADEYIENHLYILKNAEGCDKQYHLFLDRSDIESDDLAELEKHLFDWAEGEYHNGNYEIVDVDQVKYTDALNEAVEMMNASDDGELFLEITSALKQAASNHGIAYGAEMQSFVDWANEQLSKD
tara:strand:- start:543 stop:1025 length:483 start_codon:yes stop_codon:yes gene_type:complete